MFVEDILKRRIGTSRRAIIVTDAVLNVVFMNGSAESMLGYRIPSSPSGVAAAPELVLDLTISAAMSGHRFEGTVKTADGRSLSVTLDVTTIPDGCGISGFIFRMTRRVGSVSDIWPS